MTDYITASHNGEASYYHPSALKVLLRIEEEASLVEHKKMKTGTSASAVYLGAPATFSNAPMKSGGESSGANEFAQHLRRAYPGQDGSALPVLLREHNARLVLHVNELKAKLQKEMFSFADKLAKARLTGSVVLDTNQRHAVSAGGGSSYVTPVNFNSKVVGSCHVEENEETSTGHSPYTRKRLFCDSDQISCGKGRSSSVKDVGAKTAKQPVLDEGRGAGKTSVRGPGYRGSVRILISS
ncbi:uncharacterized protein LOC112271394 isoform X3 [Brachypodium distachyon]|uniref:uncharacterized protein LOC112271394 isoform X3 n=1 Tax=Brachypodium distachyon TaxID=15368 RepID=UPI000D0CB137|nr:uncharacterized protein LOC112271394 isoform X3 [Brachypodium distachyon]|eukprot:XP_024316144.1 uncharacterized protein LOC112271394 isoform X3 [Brachypodium distachyon]